MADAALLGFASLAIGAGVTTFFSPCPYALLSGYVGYYLSDATDEGNELVGATIRGVAAVVGVVLLLFGLAVLLDRGTTWHVTLPHRRSSVLGFGAFGAIYAVGAAGCVAPLFLAILVRAMTIPPGEALIVLAAYTAGFGVLVLGATVAIAVGEGALVDWLAGHRRLLNRVAGVAIMIAGAGQLLISVPV